MVFLCCNTFPTRVAAEYTSCFSQINTSDADGDRDQSQAEYAELVRLMTAAAIDEPYESLPVQLGNLYAYRSSGGTGGVDISGIDTVGDFSMESYCRSIYSALVEALDITTTERQCFVAMTIGDTDRNNLLFREPEWVTFANTISGGDFGITLPFVDLPGPVRVVFEDFSAGEDSVSVLGSKPGVTPTNEQLVYLQNMCRQISISIVAGEQPPLDPEPTPAPVQAPSPSEQSPTVSFPICRNAIIVSDLNRDDYLNEEEYVRFVNRLSDNEWAGDTYDAIPAVLQDTYVDVTDETGQIPVVGSKPGQVPTPEQEDHLNRLCFDTDEAIDIAINGVPPTPNGAPTPAPGRPAPTASPTESALDFAACKLNMVVADINRDDRIFDTEYVRFLNRFTQNTFAGRSFEELDPILQENFITLATNDFINVNGSKPGQTASPPQEDYLLRVCEGTLDALDEALRPTTAQPTAAPTSLQVDSRVVYNSFVMSNTMGLRASSLISGRERRGLEDGWITLTEDVVSGVVASPILIDDGGGLSLGGTRRTLRGGSIRRRMEVLGLTELSSVVYQINDLICPDYVTAEESLCQEVFAEYAFDYANEVDPDSIADGLFHMTVAAINAGDLQDQITAANAITKLIIGQTTDTVRPPGLEPTVSPGGDISTPAPTRGSEPKEDSGESSIGVIMGALVGVLAVLGGGGYWYYRRRNGGGGGGGCLSGFSMPSFSMPAKGKKPSGSQEGTNPDRDDGIDVDDDENMYGQDPNSQKGGLGGIFGSNKGSNRDEDEGDDDDRSGGFSVQEQSPGKGEEKSSGKFFGMGKKKHSDDNLGAFNIEEEEGGAADFIDYGFDEPDDVQKAPQPANDFFATGEEDKDGSPNWNQNDQPHGDPNWGGSNEWEGAEDQTKAGFFGAGGGGGTILSGLAGEEASGFFDEDDDSQSEESGSYDDDEMTRDSQRSGSVLPENMRQLDALVEKGDWDGVMAAAAKFETDLDKEPSLGSEPSEALENEGDESKSSADDKPFGAPVFAADGFDDAGSAASGSVVTFTSEENKRRSQYREQVEALVRKTVPDEIDNVDAMLNQFEGREAELINTLQTMYERSSTQRARKAVHKSKGVPERASSAFNPGGTEGSAAIAAASTLGVKNAYDGPSQTPQFGGGFDGGQDDFDGGEEGNYIEEEGDFDDDGNYDDEGEGSYDDEEGDFDDGQDEFDGGFDPGVDEEDGSQAGSDQDNGFEGDEFADDGFDDGEGSYVSGEGSGSYQSGEGSYVGGEGEGSYVSGEGSASGSYVSGEGSYVSGEGSASGSYVSGEGEGSYLSGEGSGSYVSGEGEGSYLSGEGSGSYVSGEGEGSYLSGEGSASDSYVSGEGEGSYVSGEGSASGSYVSGEGEGSYVSGEGEGSYVSGEGSATGSYVSGEGSYAGKEEGSYRSGSGSYQSGSGSYQSGNDDGGGDGF